MKTSLSFLLMSLLVVNSVIAQKPEKGKSEKPDSSVVKLANEAKDEAKILKEKYEADTKQILEKLEAINKQLEKGSFSTNAERDSYIKALNARLDKADELKIANADFELQNLKLRYKKGIDLIKLLYEKTLDLDHHFQALKAHQTISSLSNPVTYPEFNSNLNEIKGRLNKSYKLKLPEYLNSNPYISAAFSLVSSIIGGGNRDEREETLRKMSCILDFTSRMSADLNIIYFETEFLKERNRELNANCQKLFATYTKTMGYIKSLDHTREGDGWNTLTCKIDSVFDKYSANLSKEIEKNPNYSPALKNDVNFSIEKLLDFINEYSFLVNQGNDYYKKFLKITGNYSNASCQTTLPESFTTLKEEIDDTIDKFNKAYNLPDLKGSRLREILYGDSK